MTKKDYNLQGSYSIFYLIEDSGIVPFNRTFCDEVKYILILLADIKGYRKTRTGKWNPECVWDRI